MRRLTRGDFHDKATGAFALRKLLQRQDQSCGHEITENLEVDNGRKPLKRVTRRAKCLVSVRKIEEAGCPAIIASAAAQRQGISLSS